jgi:NAD+ kinase
MNEVVLDRGSSSALTNISVYESGHLMTVVQADGVLVATPTGSTAYSAAAGGSMVHPNVPAILFTPICPHSLNFRPIVLPDYADLELRVAENARSTAWVSFDGKHRQELHRGDVLRVTMSSHPVATVNRIDQTQDWMEGLDRCFGWSNRLTQKGADWERCTF